MVSSDLEIMDAGSTAGGDASNGGRMTTRRRGVREVGRWADKPSASTSTSTASSTATAATSKPTKKVAAPAPKKATATTAQAKSQPGKGKAKQTMILDDDDDDTPVYIPSAVHSTVTKTASAVNGLTSKPAPPVAQKQPSPPRPQPQPAPRPAPPQAPTQAQMQPVPGPSQRKPAPPRPPSSDGAEDDFFVRKPAASKATQRQPTMLSPGSSSSTGTSSAESDLEDDDEQQDARSETASPARPKRGRPRKDGRSPQQKKKSKSKSKQKEELLVLPEWAMRAPSSSKMRGSSIQQSVPPDADGDAAAREGATPRAGPSKKRKAAPRVADDSDDDDIIEVQRRRKRDSLSLTPPEPLDETFIDRTISEMRQGFRPVLSASEDDMDGTGGPNGLSDSELDPALREVMLEARRKRKEQKDNPSVYDFPVTIEIYNADQAEPMFEHRQQSRQPFRDLFDRISTAKGIALDDLVLSYKTTTLLAFGSPHALKMPERGAVVRSFTRAEWAVHRDAQRALAAAERDRAAATSSAAATEAVSGNGNQDEQADEGGGAGAGEAGFKLTVRGPGGASVNLAVKKATTSVLSLLKHFLKSQGMANEFDKDALVSGRDTAKWIEFDGERLAWDTTVEEIPDFEEEDTLDVHL